MKLLAFDCAAAGVSAAVLIDGTAVSSERASMQRGQGESLIPMIQRVLASAKLSLRDLDALATTIGPGSYTGLRIGLSAAAGLTAGTGLPVVGVTTLAALAAEAQAKAPGAVIVALESQRADLFFQGFDAAGRPLAPPEAAPPQDVKLPPGSWRLAGDGAPRLVVALGLDPALVVTGVARPDAVWVGKLAQTRLTAEPALLRAAALPQPLYLRAPLATPLAPA